MKVAQINFLYDVCIFEVTVHPQAIGDVIRSNIHDDGLISRNLRTACTHDYYVERFNSTQRDTTKVLVRRTRSGLRAFPLLLT
eukprot:766778-Hanusia_phi.AAC.2